MALVRIQNRPGRKPTVRLGGGIFTDWPRLLPLAGSALRGVVHRALQLGILWVVVPEKLTQAVLRDKGNLLAHIKWSFEKLISFKQSLIQSIGSLVLKYDEKPWFLLNFRFPFNMRVHPRTPHCKVSHFASRHLPGFTDYPLETPSLGFKRRRGDDLTFTKVEPTRLASLFLLSLSLYYSPLRVSK